MKKLNIIAKGENPSDLRKYVERDLSDKEIKWYLNTVREGGSVWLVKKGDKILGSTDISSTNKKPKSSVLDIFGGIFWSDGQKTIPKGYKIEKADKNFYDIIEDIGSRLKK